MEKEVKIIPEEITIFRIDVVKSVFNFPEVVKEGIVMNIAHDFLHNLKEQQIKVRLYIYFSTDDNTDKTEDNFIIDFYFQIENLTNFYELNKENYPVFSTLLVTTLLGLSFSTARGILFEKIENAKKQNLILPVINPNHLLQTRHSSNQDYEEGYEG